MLANPDTFALRLEEIKAKGLETIDEQGFFDLLRNGVPAAKRALMAEQADVEPPAKKSKKSS